MNDDTVSEVPIYADGQIEIGQAFANLWRYRLSGLIVVLLSLAAAITYLHIATYKYSAVLVVVPAEQTGSKVPGGLAGLGSLVGINMSGQQGSSFIFYDDTVRSPAIAAALSRDPKIMRTIFSDQWDANTQRWFNRPSTLKSIAKFAKTILGVPIKPWAPPSADDLQLYIDRHVSIVEDKLKAKLTITFTYPDRQFAGYFLERANYETDEFLRANSLRRTTAYAAYLEKRLGQVSVAEYRQSLAETLATYEKTRMMASSNVSFAAEKFGRVWLSPKPTQPLPFVVLIVAVAVGLLLWIAAILLCVPLIRAIRRQSRS